MEYTNEQITELKESILFKKKNVYSVLDEAELAKMEEFCKGYVAYLDASKTEREAVNEGIALAKAKGFREYHFGDAVKAGDKFYFNNRGKELLLFIIGSENIENGIRISAAHVDSPRIDLKQHPLYEDSGMAFFKTHYYGGIKKYQWTAIPLAIHGTVMKRDGSVIDIVVGEDESDPVFYIDDLLPHLARGQASRPLGDAIQGEQLNILVGSKPLNKDGEIKLAIMKLLNEKYGIVESDFISAELSMVPAFKARDIGFDRSLIGGYGHDDRVCAYPAIAAILEQENPTHTLMAILADKEETGSGGNTGMKSYVFIDIIASLAKSLGANEYTVRYNSKCLSADVNAAYDPNFGDVYEARNSSFINQGVVMTKYTGSGGKNGTSDASAEFVGFVRNMFDNAGIVWQTGELGKVDCGGGGTVAVYIAEKNIDVVDLGVPVLSMHAPYEVIAKADIYMAYKAFRTFCE
ncbi:MAG: aminopeptidase [Clostridia bacterium]|nr:aminopeptidase [Clostridia bacterium]